MIITLFEKLIEKINYSVENGKKIMFLSGVCISGYSNSRSINALVYGLNYITGSVNSEGGIILNPQNELKSISFNGEAISMKSDSSWNSYKEWNEEIQNWQSGGQNLVIINNVDLLNEIPGKQRVTDALNNVKLSVGFGITINDTLKGVI